MGVLGSPYVGARIALPLSLSLAGYVAGYVAYKTQTVPSYVSAPNCLAES
jgi:hypothetical protein